MKSINFTFSVICMDFAEIHLLIGGLLCKMDKHYQALLFYNEAMMMIIDKLGPKCVWGGMMVDMIDIITKLGIDRPEVEDIYDKLNYVFEEITGDDDSDV